MTFETTPMTTTPTTPTSPFEGGEPRPGGYRDISVHATVAATGAIRLIDVREPAEFDGELGHLATSELVPLATVVDAAAAWPKDRDLILICRSGNRSGRAAEALVARGFTRVMNMAGGMLAVNAAGLPVERR
ncbi:MAG: rhodanese-like domain-containing protein [Kofleriaceae bacterium]